LSLLTGARIQERGRQLPADRLCQFASRQPVDRQEFLHGRLGVLPHALERLPLLDLDLAVDLVVAPLVLELIVQAGGLGVQDAAAAPLGRIGIRASHLDTRYTHTHKSGKEARRRETRELVSLVAKRARIDRDLPLRQGSRVSATSAARG